MSKKSFFLIGFMGVGKTTVGRDLAKRLGMPFYDLDRMIEERAGKSVAEIFLAGGEEAFRTIETRVLQEMVSQEPGVIATGGGTFTRPENRELIRTAGVSVWLDAPAEMVIDRGARGEHRPLWVGPDKAKALLDQRLAHYRQADLRFDLKTWSSEEAAELLAEMLEPYRGAR
ncbi:MAG: shikimate kinase [Acidobacteriota bacterium]